MGARLFDIDIPPAQWKALIGWRGLEKFLPDASRSILKKWSEQNCCKYAQQRNEPSAEYAFFKTIHVRGPFSSLLAGDLNVSIDNRCGAGIYFSRCWSAAERQRSRKVAERWKKSQVVAGFSGIAA